MVGTVCGSPTYMAPEILMRKPYSIKSDVWSVGCVIYELFNARPPFIAQSCFDLLSIIKTEWRMLSLDRIPRELQIVMKGMLNPVPTHRMNISEACLYFDIHSKRNLGVDRSVPSADDQIPIDQTSRQNTNSERSRETKESVSKTAAYHGMTTSQSETDDLDQQLMMDAVEGSDRSIALSDSYLSCSAGNVSEEYIMVSPGTDDSFFKCPEGDGEKPIQSFTRSWCPGTSPRTNLQSFVKDLFMPLVATKRFET